MAPKNKPSGYSMYMKEYIEKQKPKIITMPQAQILCADGWKALTPEQQAVYKARAKTTVQNTPVRKYNCDGIDMAVLERQALERDKAEAALDADVYHLVDDLTRGETLEDFPFFIIHANIFCKTQKNEYIPAEIAILEFSLFDGERDIYHRIVNPGKIPSGYSFEAMKHTKETHMIPIPGVGAADTFETLQDAEFIDDAFLKMIAWFSKRQKSPILFAWPDNVEVVRGALDEMERQTDYERLVHFRVTSAAKLLFELKRKCADVRNNQVFPFLSSAEDEIGRDVFGFNATACHYHENTLDEDCREQYCSVSYVRRMLYMICDHCCKLLEIELEPLKHCPEGFKSTLHTPASVSYVGTSVSHRETGSVSGATSVVGLGSEADGWSSVSSPRRGRGRGRGRF